MATTYLTRSLASTNTSWTFSAWVKRSGITATNYLISWGNSGTDATGIGFNADDTFQYYSESSPDNKHRKTSAKYRDTNGFYHLVCKCDSNAITLYVNGEEPTQSWSTGSSANPLDTSTMAIGKWITSAYYHNGSMSHIHFSDGYAYSASTFGETDSTTGEWKINTSPSVTYGTNGFFILKDGNSVTDQSGNSNNFTVGGGTLTNTLDCPDNVFATMNPLNANIGATIPTLSMGNNRTSNSIINKMQTQYSTIAPSTGKFYCEVKATAGSAFRIGISSYNSNQAQGSSDTQNRPGQFSEGWGYDKTGNVYKTESSVGSYTAYNTGDIICIALDMTNKKLYFKRNANAWENSANPATGSNGIDISSIPSGTGMAFGAGLESGSVGAAYADFNFGNGYFGTTAVTTNSGNGYAGAEGASKFNYQPPTGFSALNTKGLNQ